MLRNKLSDYSQVFAVGDIHGCKDLLDNIHSKILKTSKNKEGEKLFLGEDKKLYVDDRWAQSIRRRVDGSTRYDVLFPFFNCYLQSLVRYSELTSDEMELVENSLKGLEILKSTYEDFGELNLFYIEINNTLENVRNARVNKKDASVNCEIIKARRNKNRRWGEDV